MGDKAQADILILVPEGPAEKPFLGVKVDPTLGKFVDGRFAAGPIIQKIALLDID